MALNYKKSGDQALVEIVDDIIVQPGGFHIIGKKLGVAISGGKQGDTIPVALRGVFDLACEGDAFEPGTLLHFSIPNLKMYSGVPEISDFANVGIAYSAGGGTLESSLVSINAHFGTIVE